MAKLESKHFDLLSEKESHDKKFKYCAYKPTHSSIILYSELGIPIASLQFNSKNNKSIITERPLSMKNYGDFQGIATKDNVEFELIISNLTDLGEINFNIHLQDSISPLNEINVLAPFESAVISSDHNFNNKALVLKATKKMVNNISTNITVKEADSDSAFLKVVVFPEINKKKLGNLFAKTCWKCSNTFMIKQNVNTPNNNVLFENVNTIHNHLGAPIPIMMPHQPLYTTQSETIHNQRSISVPSWFGPINNNIFNTHTFENPSNFANFGQPLSEPSHSSFVNYNQPTSTPSHSSFVNYNQPLSTPSHGSLINFNQPLSTPSHGSFVNYNQLTSAPSQNSFINYSQPISAPSYNSFVNYSQPTSSNLYANNDYIRSVPPINLFNTLYSPSAPSVSSAPSAPSIEFFDDPETIIEESYIGQVVTGKEVKVESIDTDVNFDYDNPAEKCVIGLSISNKIEFKNIGRNIYVECANELIRNAISNSNKLLLESLKRVYSSKECCICFDKKPNVIFYQCGHQCCHKKCSKNITKCPLCRSIVSAHINV